MNIDRLETQDCGVLPALQLTDLSPQLNVILGPNGSGKTSLLRFARDLLQQCSGNEPGPSPALSMAGLIDLETRHGPVRVLRVPRPGHPHTVAVAAGTSAATDLVRQTSPSGPTEAAALVRFVEPTHLHQNISLARLADALTSQLCDCELGPNRDVARSLNLRIHGTAEAYSPEMSILMRLAGHDAAEQGATANNVGDLATIEANWQTVVGALARQREQLTLECEAHVRMQARRQREWETRLRWFAERAVEQLEDVERLDADWQAAIVDEREAHPSDTQLARVAARELTTTGTGELERRLDLLRRVLEDLAQDRVQILCGMAHNAAADHESLAVEIRRIDGCEREVVGQMQRIWKQYAEPRGTPTAAICPACGTRHDTVAAPESAQDASDASRRAAGLQAQLFQARDRLAATQCRMARLESLRRRAGDDATADRLRYEISVLDEGITELEARHRAEIAAAALTVRFHVYRRFDVLRQAGQRLAVLTSGRYTALRWNPDDGDLLVCDSTGEPAPVAALSRGASEQVAMALRLSIVQAQQGLGISGPMLWDEPLADSDEQRLDAAAALLSEFTESEGQLLLFTCREHVAGALELHGARVHRIGQAAAPIAEPVAVLVQAARVAEPVAEDLPVSAPAAVRVHPGATYWLHGDAPVDQVPSLGLQFSRRLTVSGITDVRGLLEFDPATDAGRLAELQITVAQVRIWQAEARLLTEVADLTARDAQLLVSSGIMTREDLAKADVEELTRRIDRLRGGDTLRWRFGASTAPHRETIGRWVESAQRQPPADPSRRTETPTEEVAARRRRGRSAVQPARTPRSPAPAPPPAVASRFRLQPDSQIVDAPSIGHKTARRFQRVGIATVRDLLACDPKLIAPRLRHRRITGETVLTWQRQAGLMCSVPDLRCADAIVLTACGITGPLDLRRISPAALQASLGPLVASAAGQRLLRGATPPTYDDVVRWIETVEESRVRRAA